MTAEEVRTFIREQVAADDDLGLKSWVVPPQRVPVIVRDGTREDETLTVWLVGEKGPDGYKIIMRDDGSEFGLAAAGFPTDAHPVLVGWYGDLKSAFLCM